MRFNIQELWAISNSFFNCKTLHMIVINYVYINCDKLLGETTCLPILLYKYQFCTILKLPYNLHMLHLVANSTSPYCYDLLFFLLLLSPILIPRCWLVQFLNPMGSPFKIASNPTRFIYVVKHCDHVRRFAFNNAKATSSFECGPSLVSFNVKLAWSLA